MRYGVMAKKKPSNNKFCYNENFHNKDPLNVWLIETDQKTVYSVLGFNQLNIY
jgi:hypothetical protein